MKRYRLQRKLLGPVYRPANMQRFAATVDAVLDRVVAELRGLDGEEVDLKEWMHIVAVECLGAVVLGWSPGFLKSHSDFGSSRSSYFNWRRKSVFGLFPSLIVADLYLTWIGKAFSAVWGLSYTNSKDYRSFFPAVGQKVSARIRKGLRTTTTAAAATAAAAKPSAKAKKNARQHRDLMSDLLDLHKNKPEFKEAYLRRLAVTNFGAGHETMCSALTAAMAMVGSHRPVLGRVADEVRQTSHEHDSITSAHDASTLLPYTSASIREAQRLHPAIGMSLSRTVPLSGPVQLHGYHFPPGTVVGCNPLALQRNEAIFGPDAGAFRPERWFESDSHRRRDMDRINLTWGGGPRTCPGRYLAELVVYKTVVALVHAFDVEVVMPAEDQIQYYFLAMLTGVKARFRSRTVIT
ncbi:benzoate 4-monooxygenase cytochrome p450 [Niveomyces insectorum RCEF 264]|uniref:Benzoate 4-monooxygenase cytochrome p450 n=1 Tax=Niveomyces insectorum RCEF 264 TaxID=1081102 RepID=A0A167N836_9HYPO|nr:benzoate 4-monooxygenase cytochrome p450 [Niveomyces insectorum RCEF 264]